MVSEAQKRARKNYRKKGKRVTIEFYQTELHLVDWINQQSPKQTYVKDLIRADMENRNK